MTFKIINNLSTSNNHLHRLKKLFEDSDNVIVASPFLMTDFADFFEEIDYSSLHKFHLITTLSPKSFDQIHKISSLVSLIDFPIFKEGKIDCQISINNKLHGKVYIFKKSNEYFSALISSANFTDSGLSKNHEWGIEISEQNEIRDLEKSILSGIEILNLTPSDIYLMQQATNDFLTKQPKTEIRDIDLNLISILKTIPGISPFDDSIDYWLKPIGVTERPVPEDRLFDTINDELHFSKMRPNGVKPNDILITYGVGPTKILSLYKVASYPERVSDEEISEDPWLERWPWYVEGINLTPKFGKTWFQHDLYINSLQDEYLRENPKGIITAVGGKTLGGLNFGKDKLKLSPEFAKFIIDKVMAINEKK